MLKLGSNGVRSLSCRGQILGFVHHYSKSLQTKKDPNNESPFSVSSYLVESLGFSNEQAISTSAKLIRSSRKVSGLNVATNVDSVVKFFEQNGFDQSHIRNAVCGLPSILLARVDKTLKPKFEAFKELGLSESDITQVVSLNPSILKYGLNSTILPAIRALKEVLPCDAHVFEFIKKTKWIAVDYIVKYMVPNVALLQSYGIPIELIRKQLIQQATCFRVRTESLKDVLVKAEHKWGFCRDSKMFIYGVTFLASYDDKSIELKCRVFKNFGWTDSDTLALFRKNPYALILTEEKIEKRLNFLMNEVGYVPAFLAANPSLFTYSLERRLVPRHRVLQLLKEKCLIKKDYSLSSAASLKETKFFERFVRPFTDEVPDLHEIYAKSIGHPALGREDDT